MPKFETLGLTPDMERYQEQQKSPGFESRKLEDLTKAGEQRLEKALVPIRQVKDRIKAGFGSLFLKAKRGAEIVASLPEIKTYGQEMAKTKASELYQGVAGRMNEFAENAGIVWEDNKKSIIDGAKQKYDSIEQRAIEAYASYQVRVEAAKAKAAEEMRKKQAEEVLQNIIRYQQALNQLMAQAQALGLNISHG